MIVKDEPATVKPIEVYKLLDLTLSGGVVSHEIVMNVTSMNNRPFMVLQSVLSEPVRD